MTRIRPSRIALNVAVALISLVVLFPLFWMVSVSFMSTGEAAAFPPPILPARPTLEQVRAVAAQDQVPVDLQVRDVDDPEQAGPELRERLTELVPVLVVDGRQVGHWRLTDEQVRSALRRR